SLSTSTNPGQQCPRKWCSGVQNRLESLTLSSEGSNSKRIGPNTEATPRNWCAQPMLFASLSFAAGIILVKVTLQSAWRPATWLVISAIVLFGISIYWLGKRTRLSFVIAIFSFLALGTLDYELYLTRPTPYIPPKIFNAAVTISGTVIGSNLPT